MSIFPRRARKSTRPKSPLLLKVEQIDTKLDDVIAILSASRPGSQQQQQQVQQSTPHTQHEQGFEPFEPFSKTSQEGGAGGNGQRQVSTL